MKQSFLKRSQRKAGHFVATLESNIRHQRWKRTYASGVNRKHTVCPCYQRRRFASSVSAEAFVTKTLGASFVDTFIGSD